MTLDLDKHALLNLRSELRHARRSLSTQVQDAHAAAVCKHLLSSSVFDSASCVAVFFSDDGEVDLSAVIAQLHANRIKLTAPRVASRSMSFVRFAPADTMVINQWGIREPQGRFVVDRHALDVALVPLVAFTDAGVRLGRGGGYYDRYFVAGDTLLIGVAHELQRVAQLETKSSDRRLDVVVTETGWRLCSKRAQLLYATDAVAEP